ncbi:pyridoxamine 5'-phosphate oxidase family protein [Nocardia australiensis]|uniref:pyridoxamine 5'-phosphate oxidase family protein n=1 Tax=Nocardia australiensis TaxID=2887191 RepID=UPI001D15A18B|nr:pyridoxamine 5'-phosphate oxidase family protein [Nocardia australiensis]
MPPDEELASVPVPRSLVERQADAHKRLESGFQMWLATGNDGRGAHLIPVAYVWDGSVLYTATFASSRTVMNTKAHPQVRVALGDTADVVMIDASATTVEVTDIDDDIAERYAKVSTDPRTYPEGKFVYLHLQPQRIQVWNGIHEFAGRTVMLDGRWLESSVD